jgi:hypothetical protein
MDLATTPKILSQRSEFNLELFPLARSLVNQVLCSNALTGKIIEEKIVNYWGQMKLKGRFRRKTTPR